MAFISGLDPISLVLGLVIFLFFWKISQSSGKAGLLNKLPGPIALPLFGNIIDLMEPRDKVLKNILKRQKKYGSLFRFWIGNRPTVILSKPDYIEVIMKSNKHSQKGFFYKFLHPWLGTGLLTSHGPKWASHRKLITPTFHFKVLQGFVDVFYENSKILAEKLSRKADTGEQLDIYSLVTLCTLDIICETAMGTKVHAQSKDQNQYVRSVYRLSALVVYRTSRLWLHPDFTFKLSPAGKEFQQHLDVVQGFTDSVIKSRKKAYKPGNTPRESDEGGRKATSFLDLLLESSMEGGSSKLTDVELREEVETFMFEGHDTTASGISWTLSLLGCHPKIQEDCYQELKEIFEHDPDRVPTLGDLSEMKLLERVIKEVLRLYPSVVSISRTIDEDVRFGEYLVPEGTEAIIAIYSMHRNPEYYPNPHKFDPDRFLPEESMNRHPYSYLPFSAGPRNCIGVSDGKTENCGSPKNLPSPGLVSRKGCSPSSILQQEVTAACAQEHKTPQSGQICASVLCQRQFYFWLRLQPNDFRYGTPDRG